MAYKLTREERILRVIRREEVDYLPSQIEFSDRSRDEELSKSLGLSSVSELNIFLENHLHLTFMLQDKPAAYKDVKEEINKLKELGFSYPDWDNRMVYDCWGLGHKVGVESFFVSFHPLQGKADNNLAQMLKHFVPQKVFFEKDIKKAVKYYNTPNINMQGNFSDWEKDLKKFSGKYLVWPSGYTGIYERSYQLLGWEDFMTNIILKPNVIEELLDKVTDYKIEAAKQVVKMGFKIAHSGDDLGTQTGGFFNKKMFRKFILPRLKKYWEVFNKAGIPIMFHSCGNIVEYIPDLIDAGLTILEPTQPCMDFNYLKKEFGKDLIFYGGINTQILPFISEQETRDMTKKTISILGKGGGYIIAPSQEIMNDVPMDNIKAMIETIKKERTNVLF